jgi:hypothetical protein
MVVISGAATGAPGTATAGATTFGAYGVAAAPTAGAITGFGSEYTGGACKLPIGAPMPVAGAIGGGP